MISFSVKRRFLTSSNRILPSSRVSSFAISCLALDSSLFSSRSNRRKTCFRSNSRFTLQFIKKSGYPARRSLGFHASLSTLNSTRLGPVGRPLHSLSIGVGSRGASLGAAWHIPSCNGTGSWAEPDRYLSSTRCTPSLEHKVEHSCSPFGVMVDPSWSVRSVPTRSPHLGWVLCSAIHF